MRGLRTLLLLFGVGLAPLAFPSTVAAQASPATATATATADGQSSGPLFDALARMDSLLFDASFVRCDATTANAIFSDDVEFYHDVTGLAVGEKVREDTRTLTASCPGRHGVRRVLVPGSLRVYPIAGYGAVQMGTHRFDEQGSPTSTLTRFVHVWREERGVWRLARVLSLDHHAVPAR
jgi:hypothetical protein